MTAAATTTVADDREESPLVLELCARFERSVSAEEEGASLRAEAVVMRTDSRSVSVEAELHCDGSRVATFDATYTRERRTAPIPTGPARRPVSSRPPERWAVVPTPGRA